MGSSNLLPPPGQPTKGPDPAFTTGAVPNIVTFAFDMISPPSSLYIQRDDRLHVKIMNSLANAVLILTARLLLPSGPLPGQPDAAAQPAAVVAQQYRGWITTILQQFNPTSDRTPNEFDVQLAEGYLLSVCIADASPTPLSRGQAFVSIGLQRSPVVGGKRFQELLADDPATNLDPGWPGGRQIAPTEGPGFIHSIQIPNPAAGADFSFTVPAGARLRLASLNAVITTSATVANRTPAIVITDGANAVWTDDVPTAVPASTTANVSMTGANVPTGVVTTTVHCVIPPGLIMPPGWNIHSLTGALQAGDQWTAIWMNVEEWINI